MALADDTPAFPTSVEKAFVSALIRAGTCEAVAELVAPEQIADGASQAIYRVLLDEWRNGAKWYDTSLVSLRIDGLSQQQVVEFLYFDGSVTQLDRYLREILNGYQLREIGKKVAHLAEQFGDGNVTDSARAVEVVRSIAESAQEVNAAPLPGHTLTDLRDLEYDDMPDFLVAGLIRRESRTMIVAEEGAGKSVLTRQLAMCAAAGVHPFQTMVRSRPVRTMLIDVENDQRLVHRERDNDGELKPTTIEALDAQLTSKVGRGNWSDHFLYINRRREGFNLRSQSDRASLWAAAQDFGPQIVIFSPLYKMSVRQRDEDYEQEAAALQSILERFIERFGCAIVFEHHAPKKASGAARDLSPYGSSFWMRWPEVGLALSKISKDDPMPGDVLPLRVGRSRGDRYTVDWPTELRPGRITGSGRELPWTGYWAGSDMPSYADGEPF